MPKQKKNKDDLYYFDEAAAQRPVNFIERYCRHVVGDMQDELIEMMDYQRKIVRDVFGWKKKADGLRRYRYVYLEVPKKNAKSTLLAALGLYHTCADGAKGARVFACAGDKDQARIIFDASREMVEADKRLAQIFEVYKNVIVHKASKSRFAVISADAKTKHGPNVSALLFDELHVQPNSELWDTMTKGVANRKEPLIWAITTAGYKGSFAEGIHDVALSIQSGRVKSKFWYIKIFSITEAIAAKKWNSEKIFKEVNPGYGITVDKTYWQSQIEEVKQNPARLSAFLRLHLNVWTGSERTWEVVPHWYKGDGIVDDESLKGRTCFMGIDLAPKNDTTAVVEIYPDDDNESFDVIAHFFIPEATLDERKKNENDQWDVWVDMGLVTLMPGNITDEEIVKDYVIKRASERNVASIGCDTYNAYMLIAKLQESGLPAVAYPQTVKAMSPPMFFLEKLLIAGFLRHGANPILAYQAGNVVVYEDINQNRRPHKGKSKTRIDGIAALITAFGTYLTSMVEQEEKFRASDLIAFIDDEPKSNE